MASGSTLARIAALAFAALAAGCTAGAVVYEVHTVPVRPGPPPISSPNICTRDYVPVCGERRGNQRTFGNACEASSSGYRILYGGECRRGPRPIAGRPQQSERICTQQYQPVCARRGDRIRTFGNGCEAEKAGFRIIDQGTC